MWGVDAFGIYANQADLILPAICEILRGRVKRQLVSVSLETSKVLIGLVRDLASSIAKVSLRSTAY